MTSTNRNESLVELTQVGLRFRNYADALPSLKQTVFGMFKSAEFRHSKDHWLYENLTLSVPRGTRLGIVGRNGAGKSTLLKLICGIYRPTKGKILVRGRIAPIIELGAGMLGELSGEENIVLSGTLMGRSRTEMLRRKDAILDFAGLREHAAMPIKYYSSGMLVRLAFSTATEINPEILLLDEVFASGDAEFVARAKDRMRSLIDSAHIMILVSHQLELIAQMCNRCIQIEHGRIVADGDPAVVTDEYLRGVRSEPTQ